MTDYTAVDAYAQRQAPLTLIRHLEWIRLYEPRLGRMASICNDGDSARVGMLFSPDGAADVAARPLLAQD